MLVYRDGKEIASLNQKPDFSCCLEISWAPDSAAFFAMYSDGGAVGGWHAQVFRLAGKEVTEAPVAGAASADFAKHHSCDGGENNVICLKWVDGSSKLFLVLEVPPTSACGPQMGRFEGYIVDARNGAILARYDEAQTEYVQKHCATPPVPASANGKRP